MNTNERMYKVIASKLNWKPTESYVDQRESELDKIESDYLAHGSGIDAGCKIVRDRGGRHGYTENKFTIESEFHRMDDNGFYAGWFGFRVIVTASLVNRFNMKIELRYNSTDRSDQYIRDNYFNYLWDVMYDNLCDDIPLYLV